MFFDKPNNVVASSSAAGGHEKLIPPVVQKAILNPVSADARLINSDQFFSA